MDEQIELEDNNLIEVDESIISEAEANAEAQTLEAADSLMEIEEDEDEDLNGDRQE
jgi:hypothetical protein